MINAKRKKLTNQIREIRLIDRKTDQSAMRDLQRRKSGQPKIFI